MKYRIDVTIPTKPEWVELVLKDFPAFIQDHANCERKASAMMMSFVAKYPNRKEIISDLVDSAIEELGHFNQVFELMQKRGIPLKHEIDSDPYVNGLLSFCRSSSEERFLDRLLVSSVVECRGAERFKLVYEAVNDEELKAFYHRLWADEAKHGDLFVRLALHYFDEKTVYDRLQFFIEKESDIVSKMEIRAAFH